MRSCWGGRRVAAKSGEGLSWFVGVVGAVLAAVVVFGAIYVSAWFALGSGRGLSAAGPTSGVGWRRVAAFDSDELESARARACVAGVLRLDPRETSKRPPRESFLFRHLQLRDRTAVFHLRP